jgi:hypothetical protein
LGAAAGVGAFIDPNGLDKKSPGEAGPCRLQIDDKFEFDQLLQKTPPTDTN